MISALQPVASHSDVSLFPWLFFGLMILLSVGRVISWVRKKQQDSEQLPPSQQNPSVFSVGYQPPSDFHYPESQQDALPPLPVPARPLPDKADWRKPAQPSQPTPGISGFASSRWAAEQELKRLLTELDQRRRSGQISAEQYAAEREAIFRNR
ncbi:hypothetical protein [Psychromicrobium sp. YIM B11713]|uniref:hypothetical protein n=1 Tax=Psychromicrobium sp. YIM B11713 TaxID=3145233 RepID=UPI00374F410E